MVHILTKETSSGLMPTTFSYKAAVKCATIATGTLATAFAAGQLVDGYTLITGDRILIKDQSTASQNGVYTVNATGAPTRATDMNAATMFPGAVVAVEQGTINADSGWVCTADSGIVLETSDIVWAIFGGVKAGLGLTITADVISVTALNLGTLAGLVGVTGTPTLAIGTYDTPKVVATATDYIAANIYIQSSANAPSDDTSVIGLYCKVENTTISQPHNHLQAGLFNTNIRFNMFDAYAVQGHVTVSANVGTQNANAHVTGLSGKAHLTSATTLATGWVTGGLFIIEGAGAVTQMCHVISAVCEVGVTACQSLLHLYTDSSLNAAIQCNGTVNMTHLFDFDAQAGCVGVADIHIDIAGAAGYIPYASSAAQFVTLTGAQALTNKTNVSITSTSSAYNNSALNVGKYGTPIADTLSADNILVSFVNSSGVNKGSSDTSSMVLFVGNATTGAVTNNKMQGVLSSMSIGHNVFDAYAGQFHINISATMATQAGNANLVGLACKANIANGVTATGNVSALYVVLDTGNGDTATGQYDMIRLENNAVNCDNAINFGDCTAIANLFYVNAAGCVTADAGSPASTTIYKIKINVAGIPAYIPLYADY